MEGLSRAVRTETRRRWYEVRFVTGDSTEERKENWCILTANYHLKRSPLIEDPSQERTASWTGTQWSCRRQLLANHGNGDDGALPGTVCGSSPGPAIASVCTGHSSDLQGEVNLSPTTIYPFPSSWLAEELSLPFKTRSRISSADW